MAKRRDPDGPEDGAALWKRVTDTVKPLRQEPKMLAAPKAKAPLRPTPVFPAPVMPPLRKLAEPVVAIRPVRPPADTLDGGWDRRLRRGSTVPDRTIDLHGHTLLSAHQLLDRELGHAIVDDVRVLLLVTGRAPRADDRGADGRPKRGLIRASIGDWLASSRHAGRIAAVRNAHPKHGGAGALYIILRRRRED